MDSIKKSKKKKQLEDFQGFISPVFEEEEIPTTTPLSVEQFEEYKKVLDSTAFRKETYVTDREFAKLLIDNVVAQKQWYEGTKFVLEELKNEGLEVGIEDKDVHELLKVSDGLFKIRYYRQLIHATGLGAFEDKILSLVIERFFKPPTAGNKG